MARSSHRIARRLLAASLLLAAMCAAAQSWTGSSGSNWSTGANWLGGVAPSNDGGANLDFGASGVSFTPNADVPWSLAAIKFTAVGYAVGGATLTFPAASQITVDGAGLGNSISNVLSIASTLTLECGADFTVSGGATGPGELIKTGAGTLTYSGANWPAGLVSNSQGTLRIGDGVAGPSTIGAIVNDGHVAFDGSLITDVTGSLSGTGTVTIEAGAVVANISGGGFTHQGQTTINGTLNPGTPGPSIINNAPLVIGPGGQLNTSGGMVGSLAGSGFLNVASGTFTAGGNNTSTTFNGFLSGSGTFAKAGSGTFTFDTSSWFNLPSTVLVAGGTLRVGTPTNWPGNVGGFVNNAHLSFGGSYTDVTGPVSGTGSITIESGTWVTNQSGGAFTHQGQTTINGRFDSAWGYGASIANNGPVVIGPGGYFFTEGGTVGSLAGSGYFEVAFGTFTAGGSNASTTFSGTVAGNGSLAKTGSGTLTLAGSSGSFNGATTINAGILSVTGSHGGALTVNSGGTLGGTGSVGTVSVEAGGTLAPGLSAGTLNTLALSLSGTLSAEILGPAAGTQHDRVNVTGTVAINGATLSLSGSYVPVAGDQLILIANDGADAVTGTFSGLPEGATLTFNGRTLRISYVGGTGNDVVVSVATFTVTPSAGANGTIAPSTPQTVAHGSTTAFTVTANTGYTASVGGTCGGSLVGTTYTTQAITADCTVIASFTLKTYTVTPSAGPNGSIAPATPQTVAHGSTTSFTITPQANFAVSVAGTCGGSLAGNTYTTHPITASCTVAASFELINPPRLVNISTRMQVLTGDDVLIGGFVISGSTSKTVAVVATGPSLAAFGITNTLANPTLLLVRSSDQTVVASNDDWQAASNAAQLEAAGFAPSNPLEAAVLVNLAPGAYTAVVQGAGGGTGVGLIAVYEVDAVTTPLINISTRGRVQTGNDVMIGGFIIQGQGPQTVAIVATGPSLSAYGIASPLGNPRLTLVRSSDQSVIATNDNWQSDPAFPQLQAAGFAPSNPLEAALFVTLPPGAYTAIVSGVDNGTGVGVIGVYKAN